MKPAMKTIDLELTRIIPASPEEVFDAWLDPEGPGTPWKLADQLILDPKVDGLFYWRFTNEAGEQKPHYGRFTVVERPSRIQYTWMSPHTRGLESLVTVTCRKQGANTLLTMRHEHLPDDEFGRGHEAGWGALTDQLAARFSAAS